MLPKSPVFGLSSVLVAVPNSPVFGFSSVLLPNKPGFGFSSTFFSVFSSTFSVDLPKLKPLLGLSSFFGSAAAGGLKLKAPFVSVLALSNNPPSLAPNRFGFLRGFSQN